MRARRNLNKFYEHVLFRKTHAFKMSFKLFRTIENLFSRVKIVCINCYMTKEKRNIYKITENDMLSKFIQFKKEIRNSSEISLFKKC